MACANHSLISSCFSSAYVEILSTWEVWRALKRLELHSAAPRATLTPLSCSPNFPRAQYLDIRTLTHELIVKYNILCNGYSGQKSFFSFHLSMVVDFTPYSLQWHLLCFFFLAY